MVDRRKVLDDVGAQHVAVALRELLQPVDRPVRPLADAVGIAVGDEQPLEARLDYVAQRVMHHPVAEGRGADLAPLRLVDVEVDVRPRAVAAAFQVVLQVEQMIREAVLEGRRRPVAALAACRLAVGLQQVLPGADAAIGFAAPARRPGPERRAIHRRIPWPKR